LLGARRNRPRSITRFRVPREWQDTALDDAFDGLEQPKCPECGTVLRDVPGGYECPSCKMLFLRNQV